MSPRRPQREGLLPRDRERFLAEMLLPYGIAVYGSGAEVLFNRGYRPLWRRMPGEAARAVRRRDMWGHFHPRWLYTPPESPAESEAVRARCLAVLTAWGTPAPTEADISAAYRLDRESFAPSCPDS